MKATVETLSVSVEDGGELTVETAGDRTGRPILVHAGSPNSRHLFSGWIQDATERGAWLICYDRPGYGGSTARPGRTVADGAREVRRIAEELGLRRLAVWGFSGGGPYAIASAALLPDFVVAACAVGSIAPYGAPDLDYFSGMGEENVADIRLTLRDLEAARRKADEDRASMLATPADALSQALPTLLSAVDAAVVTGEWAEFLADSMRTGLAPGAEGWWEDSIAHLSPWGVDLAKITVPVKIWHGRHDQFVPIQHGAWLAKHVAGAEAELSDSDGHLTLLTRRVGEVHQWLLEHWN